MRSAHVRERTQSDGCSTDPEPDMETRQAHFRNMRSKCRCSCVLQFTRHHGVSSVLHRPQSQMIHCIVLCCLILRLASRDCLAARERQARLWWAPHPNRGEITNPGRGESSLNRYEHPTTCRCTATEGVRYLNKRGPPQPTASDMRSRRPGRDVASIDRQVKAPRTDRKQSESRGG